MAAQTWHRLPLPLTREQALTACADAEQICYLQNGAQGSTLLSTPNDVQNLDHPERLRDVSGSCSPTPFGWPDDMLGGAIIQADYEWVEHPYYAVRDQAQCAAKLWPLTCYATWQHDQQQGTIICAKREDGEKWLQKLKQAKKVYHYSPLRI